MAQTLEQLGRYELVERIAVGGMGEIYLARSHGTAGFEKTVIIKRILPHLAEQQEFVEKFLDEGHIVVELTHGNIVPVFDMGDVDGEYYIAMEYLAGRDLRAILKRLAQRDELMPVELAIYVLSEVCKGLGYAHRKTDDAGNSLHIVHRDVSPSNILVSREGAVKIIDFGIARAASRLAQTVSGRIQGKFCYMSPEQASGERVDRRSDIFSAGVVLYEMLTNFRPFQGETDLASLELVRRCEFEPPSTLNPKIPEEIDEIVMRALCADREERYQDIEQMQIALLQYLYAHGPAPTNAELCEFLEDLFPQGLEPTELRQARGTGPSRPRRKMSLDEALDFELGQLGDAAPEPLRVDPLSVTATNASGRELPVARTATMGSDEIGLPRTGPTEDLGPGSRSTPQIGYDTPEPPDDHSPSTDSDTQAPDGRREPDRPTSEPGASVDREALGEGGDETEADRTRPPGAEDSLARQRGFKRTLALALAVGVILGAISLFVVLTEPDGSVRVATEPSGAIIRVDGTRRAETTPALLTITPGTHTITLEKDGFKTEHIEVKVESKKTSRLTGAEGDRIVLDPVGSRPADAREPRVFTVDTQPSGARLWANNEPRGTTPQRLEVPPDGGLNLVFKHPNCERETYHLDYHHRKTKFTHPLECEAPDMGVDAGAEARRLASKSPGNSSERGPRRKSETRPSPIPVEIRAEPPDALISVQGEPARTGPIRASFRPGEQVRVTAHSEGHRPIEVTRRAREIRDGTLVVRLPRQRTGCLNFRAEYPAIAEIAIDGRWLEGRRGKLVRHELPVGTHTIRVRNEPAGKDDTFSFEIDDGEECTTLVVWKRGD